MEAGGSEAVLLEDGSRPAPFFHKWTNVILRNYEEELQQVNIYEAIPAFRDKVPRNNEVYQAIVEAFYPAANTFITPNGKLGFSLKDVKSVTGLPILGDVYDEFIPNDGTLGRYSEDFRIIYF